VPLLQQAVVDKDLTGGWCYWFARDVTGADVPLLRQTIIEKDSTGEYLAKWIQNRDSTSLPDIVQGLVEQNKPVPPLLAEQYPESLNLYKKLQRAQEQDVMCEPFP
jgi:hypothetical protein